MALLYFWLIDGELCDWQWGDYSFINANVNAMWQRYERQRINKTLRYERYNLIVKCDGKMAEVFHGSGHCHHWNHDAEIILTEEQIERYRQYYADAIKRKSQRSKAWLLVFGELTNKLKRLKQQASLPPVVCYEQEITKLAIQLYEVLPPVVTGIPKHHLVGRFCMGVSKITGEEVAGRVMRVYKPHEQPMVAIIRTSRQTIDCVWYGSMEFPLCCPSCGSMSLRSDECLKIPGNYSDCKINCLDCGHRWEVESL